MPKIEARKPDPEIERRVRDALYGEERFEPGESDPLAAARGIVVGVVLGAACWAVGFLLWWAL